MSDRKQAFFNKMDRFGDLFVLNLCFMLTCIPVITIGASVTALFTVTNRMVRDAEGKVHQAYFEAFRSNFRQSTVIWIIDVLCLGCFWIQLQYYLGNANNAPGLLFGLMGAEFILLAFALPFQFPLAARYENKTVNIIRNAFLLALLNLGTWIRLFVLWMLPAVIYYLYPRLFWMTFVLWIVILFAVFAYASSLMLRGFYEKIETELPR